jgi:hypothetical protein
MARTSHYLKLKHFWGEIQGVKQITTDCISISGGLPGGMHKHVLEKISGGGQGQQKYPAKKCRA